MNGVGLLLVVIGAVAATAAARHWGLPAALVVVAVASAVSFVPGLPRLELAPESILAVVLPPLLYSATLDTSFVSFRRNLWPIAALGVGLVVFSALTVGLFASWVVPGLTLGGAFILGSVLAPSDAVAAVTLGRKLGLPGRLMTIMTGESLVNDAVALVIFQAAVAAVADSKSFIDQPVLMLLYSATLGVGVGLVTARAVHWIRPRLHDPALETVLGVIVPFAAFLVAEEFHASGVLAVVSAAFWLGHHSADTAFATRLQSRQVWRTADVVLEAFVFAYMGLQVSFFLRDAAAEGVAARQLAAAVVLVLLAVIVVRPVWVFLVLGRGTRLRTSWKFNLVLSWTGMRGVVTLAAAAAIPAVTATGQPIPDRALIQAIALSVAVLTLLVQGATLQPLVRLLDMSTADERRRADADLGWALNVARRAARQVTDRTVAASADGGEAAALKLVERRVEQMLTTGPDLLRESGEAGGQRRRSAHELVQQILAQQRTALVRERDAGRLDDEVLRAVLQQLDYEEAAACTDLQKRL